MLFFKVKKNYFELYENLCFDKKKFFIKSIFIWSDEFGKMRMINKLNIGITKKQIVDFCRRWHIREFALFGSALRDDFNTGSDLDILVTFAPDTNWSLLDHLQMEQELSDLLGRKIDLLSKRAVENNHNWIRRKEILNTAEVFYVSR